MENHQPPTTKVTVNGHESRRFLDKHKHGDTEIKPTAQADVDRIEAMFNTFNHAFQQAARFMTIEPLDNTQIDQINKQLMIIQPGNKFMGIGMCRECLRLSVQYLRETADTLEEISKLPDSKG